MDAISRLIELARVRAVLDVRCLLAGSTVMDVPAYGETEAAFHFLLDGECTLEVGDKPYPLAAGDAVLLPSSPPHRIRTAGPAPARNSSKTAGPSFGTIRTPETTDSVIDLFCGHYTFGSGAGALLFQSLPDPIVVSFPAEDAAVGRLCEVLRQEARSDGPGTTAVLSSLCAALLAMVLRKSTGKLARTSLWTAADDDRIVQVIDAVLREPGADWPIERLAALATMSRATFLRHFTRSTGTTVGTFLVNVRMMFAADLLGNRELTIATVAAQVGYASESAFARAFREATGTTPGRFRRSSSPERT